MTTPRILVIGDSMLDRYWSGIVERISQEAPVPVLLLNEQTSRPGGAANVAVNLARLGCEATLATMIGADAAGRELLELIEHEGVRFEGLQETGARTTVKIRHVTKHQHLLRTDIEERPHNQSVDVFTRRLVVPLVKGFEYLVLSDYAKGSLSQCAEIIAAANASGCRVLVDPKGRDWERYRGAWLVKPNEAELAGVTGSWATPDDMRECAQVLREDLRIDHLLVTLGERGMLLCSAGGCLEFQADAREVFDVSGAGDTVIATLAAMLARGMDLHAAVRLANRAAGIVVGKFGTASVSLAELDEVAS